MSPLDAVWTHLGLLAFTIMTGVIIGYLLYAILNPERF